MLRLALLLAVALTAAACGDATSSPADPPAAGPEPSAGATTPPASSDAPASSVAPPAPSDTAASPDPRAVPAPAASTVDGVLSLGRPLVIGHAGGDQSWPHSTMFAFTEAARAGADVLEMDVQLTGDGVLVVQHDDTVDRTTGTTGRVRDLTYDELQELDNGYWWSTEWARHDLPDDRYIYRGIRTGERPPPEGYGPDDFRVETFRAVAEAFPDHVLDIEIKVPADDTGNDDVTFAIEGARVLAEEIEALDRTDSVVVVSFDDDVMAAFRQIAPGVTTSPGTTATFGWVVGSGGLAPSDRILQLPPEFDGIDVLGIDGLLDKADADALAIWVWPNSRDQETPDFYARLVGDIGVEGVIAGHPDQAVERFRADGLMP